MTDTARVTWWGHATVLLEDRVRVLTDPILTPRFAHLVRRRGETPPDDVHQVDVVLISHLHGDHYHLPSLRLLAAGSRVVVPRGGGRLLSKVDLDVVEIDVGEVVEVGPVPITAVRALHDGRRIQGSKLSAPALGYVIDGSIRTYFAGDTGYFPEMAELADQDGGPDLALIPVGGWGPSLRGEHLDPAKAAEALTLVQPRVAVPIHWGTFWPRGMSRVRKHLFDEPGQDFASYAATAAPDVDVRVLAPGDSISVPPATRP